MEAEREAGAVIETIWENERTTRDGDFAAENWGTEHQDWPAESDDWGYRGEPEPMATGGPGPVASGSASSIGPTVDAAPRSAQRAAEASTGQTVVVCEKGLGPGPVATSAEPLVDPPELGDRINDTAKEPYWIPGVFPTIVQKETGGPFNYGLKNLDLLTWGLMYYEVEAGWLRRI